MPKPKISTDMCQLCGKETTAFITRRSKDGLKLYLCKKCASGFEGELLVSYHRNSLDN
jgi:ribosome-binding protein aMBF1 (putative translation factor)